MTEEATALYRRLAAQFDLPIAGVDGTARLGAADAGDLCRRTRRR